MIVVVVIILLLLLLLLLSGYTFCGFVRAFLFSFPRDFFSGKEKRRLNRFSEIISLLESEGLYFFETYVRRAHISVHIYCDIYIII